MVGLLVAPRHHEAGMTFIDQPARADADAAFVISGEKRFEGIAFLKGDAVFAPVRTIPA